MENINNENIKLFYGSDSTSLITPNVITDDTDSCNDDDSSFYSCHSNIESVLIRDKDWVTVGNKIDGNDDDISEQEYQFNFDDVYSFKDHYHHYHENKEMTKHDTQLNVSTTPHQQGIDENSCYAMAPTSTVRAGQSILRAIITNDIANGRCVQHSLADYDLHDFEEIKNYILSHSKYGKRHEGGNIITYLTDFVSINDDWDLVIMQGCGMAVKYHNMEFKSIITKTQGKTRNKIPLFTDTMSFILTNSEMDCLKRLNYKREYPPPNGNIRKEIESTLSNIVRNIEGHSCNGMIYHLTQEETDLVNFLNYSNNKHDYLTKEVKEWFDKITVENHVQFIVPVTLESLNFDKTVERRTPPLVGHAAVVVRITDQGIVLKNSWGPDWGHNGLFLLSFEVLNELSRRKALEYVRLELKDNHQRKPIVYKTLPSSSSNCGNDDNDNRVVSIFDNAPVVTEEDIDESPMKTMNCQDENNNDEEDYEFVCSGSFVEWITSGSIFRSIFKK